MISSRKNQELVESKELSGPEGLTHERKFIPVQVQSTTARLHVELGRGDEAIKALAGVMIEDKISACDAVKKICKYIKLLHENLQSAFDGVSQGPFDFYLKNGLEKTQKRLQQVVESSTLYRIKQLAEENGLGIVYFDNETPMLTPPQEVVYIQLINDKNGLPVIFNIGINSIFKSAATGFDLSQFEKALELSQDHDVSYFHRIAEIYKDFEQVSDQLENLDIYEQLDSIRAFNQKWLGVLQMMFTVDERKHLGQLEVKDQHGLVNVSSSFTYKPNAEQNPALLKNKLECFSYIPKNTPAQKRMLVTSSEASSNQAAQESPFKKIRHG